MSRRLRVAVALTALALAAWWLRRSGVFGGDPWDPLTLRAWVQGAGLWGPVLFLAVAVVKPLFVPQPLGLAWVAGGIFGTTLGGCLVAVAGAGSAAVGYGVGVAGRRLFRSDLGSARAVAAGQELLARSEPGGRSDWRTVAFLRAVVPWDLVSYWAGARRLRWGPYAGGTAAALLPVSFGHAFAANALVEGQGRLLALAVPLALGLIYGPIWFFDRGARKRVADA